MAIKSVGYAGLSLDDLQERLPELTKGALLVETRSVPYSARHPQFNRDELKRQLGQSYLDYSKVLGARTANSEYYDNNGQVNFSRVENDPEFQQALTDIKNIAEEREVVLLCACKHPERCHRALLVAEALYKQQGIEVEHIHTNGRMEPHGQLRVRVAEERGFVPDMFRGQKECEELGIEAQRSQFAYTKSKEQPEFGL